MWINSLPAIGSLVLSRRNTLNSSTTWQWYHKVIYTIWIEGADCLRSDIWMDTWGHAGFIIRYHSAFHKLLTFSITMCLEWMIMMMQYQRTSTPTDFLWSDSDRYVAQASTHFIESRKTFRHILQDRKCQLWVKRRRQLLKNATHAQLSNFRKYYRVYELSDSGTALGSGRVYVEIGEREGSSAHMEPIYTDIFVLHPDWWKMEAPKTFLKVRATSVSCHRGCES